VKEKTKLQVHKQGKPSQNPRIHLIGCGDFSQLLYTFTVLAILFTEFRTPVIR